MTRREGGGGAAAAAKPAQGTICWVGHNSPSG